jgi:signal transduction histidine kinase/CheY-like chemotaxis protein
MTSQFSWRGCGPTLRAIAADRFVRLFLVAFAAELALYATPVLSAAQREALGSSYCQIPFLLIVVSGAWAGIDASSSLEERRFRLRLAIGFLWWLTALLVNAATPGHGPTTGLAFAADLSYAASYLTILLAIERRPHLGDRGGPVGHDRRMKAGGVVCFGGGWFAYFVLAPLLLDAPFYWSLRPSYVLYQIFDAVILLQAAALALGCRHPRWRAVYAMLAAAAAASLAVDLLDASIVSGRLGIRDGMLTDLLWALPPLVYLLAARVGGSAIGDAAVADSADRPSVAILEPVRAGALLLVGACSFPLVHMTLYSLYSTTPALETAHGVIVLSELGAMGGLALVSYLTLERLHRDLERARLSVEGRLRQAQRLESIGRLAGGIAHDFNNLLMVIAGYTESAAEALPPHDPVLRHLEEVHRAADRAAGLTRQLLAFSRRQVLKTERLDLNEVITTLHRMLERVIGEDVVLDTRLATDLGDVMADRAQIESVVLTLAANARDTMPHGGVLTFSTTDIAVPADGNSGGTDSRQERYIELVVSDDGAGIPPEAQPHVFEPFFSASVQHRDVGLGLATVYGIVTQSGGTISVVCPPRQGTTFTIRLPRAADEPRTQPIAEPLAPSPAGETILVAEDEPAILDLTRALLERQGYSVIAAASGEEAVDLASTHAGPISLLVTDVKMPGMDGLALANRLAGERPGLRVLYMTGNAAGVAWPAGVTDDVILWKPFTGAGLAGQVRSVLGGPTSPS